MNYYCDSLRGGGPYAVYRFDLDKRVSEVYTRKQRYWRKDWHLLWRLATGDLSDSDTISEEEAMEIIESFG